MKGAFGARRCAGNVLFEDITKQGAPPMKDALRACGGAQGICKHQAYKYPYMATSVRKLSVIKDLSRIDSW